MSAVLLLVLLAVGPANETARVYPSGATIPVNCLRLSIQFSEAQERPVLPRLQLRDSRGAALKSPFLEEELWSPDRRTLTILFHPGRLKEGVGPHERLGPPLAGIKQARLTLDGVRLKTWIVASPCGTLEPRGWRVGAPPVAGSHSALRLRLDKPIDEQAEPLIAIVDRSGQRVMGKGRLVRNETLWQFTPAEAWQPGEYRFVLHPQLEDACGDRLGEAFEQLIVTEYSRKDAPDLRFVIGTDHRRRR